MRVKVHRLLRPGIPALPKWLLGILGLSFIIKLAFLLYYIRSGLDITDEGWYLLAYRFPETNPNPLHEFHTLLNTLFGWSGLGVVAARLLKIILEFSGIFLLTLGVVRWLRTRTLWEVPPVWEIFLLASLGSVHVWSRAINYNDLTYFMFNASCGLLLLSIAYPRKERRNIWLLAIFSGILLGLQIPVKLSSAMALFLLLSGILMVEMTFRKEISHGLLALLMILLGAAGSFIAFTLPFGGPLKWIQRWMEGYEFLSSYGYNYLKLFEQNYAPDLWKIILVLIIPVLSGVLGIFIINKRNFRSVWARPLVFAIMFGAFLFIGFLGLGYGFQWVKGVAIHEFWFYSFYIFGLFGYFFYLNLVFPRDSTTGKNHRLAGTVLTFISFIPLGCWIGSDNALTTVFNEFLAPWALITGLMGIVLIKRQGMKWLVYLIFILLTLFSTFQLVYINLNLPYRLVKPLTRQNTPLPGKEHLKVDAATAEFIGNVKEELKEHGFEPGDPIIAVYDMPGLVWAVNGRSVGMTWIQNPVHGDIYCEQFRKSEVIKPPVVLLSDDVSMKDVRCISTLGYSFPESYKKTEVLFNPFSKDSVHIWFHRATL